MNIKSVCIKNFRLFANFYLELNNIIGLVGENGAGKTTILEAINYATTKQGLLYKLNDSDFRSGCSEFSIEVRFDSLFSCTIPDGYNTKDILCDGVLLEVKRRERSQGRALNEGFVISRHICLPVEYVDIQEISANVDISGLNCPLSVVRRNPDSYDYQITRNSGSFMQVSEMLLILGGKVKNFPNVFYFDKNREKQSNKGFSTTFQKILDDFNWRYVAEKNNSATVAQAWNEINQIWNNYYYQTVNSIEDIKDGRVIYPLREKLNRFFGTQKYENLQVSLLNLHKPFENGFFSIKEESSIEQIQTSSLGSGEGIMLAYFLLKIISELSREEIIFLIDEPELHLHPQAQIKFYNDIISGDTQVIYATHSDLFVSLGYRKYIKRISSSGECFPNTTSLSFVTLNGTPIEGHLLEMNQYYQDKSIFFRENNEIFFGNKILLVEGPADKYGLPILANVVGNDFSNSSIISCNGKEKIKYYISICKAFGMDFFVVFDLDGGQITEGENNIINVDSGGNCIYFNESFESELGVGTTVAHKASECLAKIDRINNRDEVSDEIKRIIQGISDWMQI